MPIHCPIKIAALNENEFEAVDYRVMGHAYASQNKLGRFCEEWAYEADLKERLRADGFRSVQTQVPVVVEHGDFSKTYRLDMVADSAVYELKTDHTIVAEHEAQLFGYLFLLGVQRGKLLNFRPPKVQGKLIATSLDHESRRQFSVVADRWEEITPDCARLRQTLLELLSDWGVFLTASLYQEALVHLFGGVDSVERPVRLHRENVILGSQKMLLCSPCVAFRATAYTEATSHVEVHLRRLLALTDLKALQWVNLNHAKVEFTTLKNERGLLW